EGENPPVRTHEASAADAEAKRVSLLADKIGSLVLDGVIRLRSDPDTAHLFPGASGSGDTTDDIVNRFLDALTTAGVDASIVAQSLAEKVKAKLPDTSSQVHSEDEAPESPLADKSTNHPVSGGTVTLPQEEERGRTVAFGSFPAVNTDETPGNKHRHRSRSRDEIMGTIARDRAREEAEARVARETASLRSAQGNVVPPVNAAQVASATKEARIAAQDDDPSDLSSSSDSSSDDDKQGGWKTPAAMKKRFPKPGSRLVGVSLKSIKSPFKLEITRKYDGENDSPVELERWYSHVGTQLSIAKVHRSSLLASTVALNSIEGQAAEWATREIQRDLNLYLP
ncbi:hypothetical protein JCM11641_007598, partial [Rhodosporidiobolus odoratus]